MYHWGWLRQLLVPEAITRHALDAIVNKQPSFSKMSNDDYRLN